MSIRKTRLEYARDTRAPRKPKKLNGKQTVDAINRIIKRQAVKNGLIDPSKPRFYFRYAYQDKQGIVQANTISEARSLIKREFNISRQKRLPLGVVIEKIGDVQDRDLPISAVIERAN